MEIKDALQFWQKEVHYYEARAGEQGAAAFRAIIIVVGATAAIPVAVNVLPNLLKKLAVYELDVRYFFLIIPAAVLLLWATAVRLLHEMHILRAYVEFSEDQVAALTTGEPLLRRYRPWYSLGGAYDAPKLVMGIFFVVAIALSLVGTIGVAAVVASTFEDQSWLAFTLFIVTFLVLVVGLIRAYRSSYAHKEQVLSSLRANNTMSSA